MDNYTDNYIENDSLVLGKDVYYGDYVKFQYEDGTSSIVKLSEKNENNLYSAYVEPIDTTLKTMLNTKNFIHILGNKGYEENGMNYFVCPLGFKNNWTNLIPCLYVIISQDEYGEYVFVSAGFGEYKVGNGIVTLDEAFPFKNNYGQYYHELQHVLLKLYGIDLELDIEKIKSKI